MSAFIVSNETMHRSVEALRALSLYSLLGVNMRQPSDADLTALGRKLYVLNCAAVCARYPNEGRGEPSMAESYVWRAPRRESTHVGNLKCLQCLLYQCNEDPVCDDPDFKELESCMAHLAMAVVADLPAYVSAPWGACD